MKSTVPETELRALADARIKARRAPLKRSNPKRAPKASRFIAYDFETDLIGEGTPNPRYLTAHSLDPAFSYAGPIRDFEHLHDVLVNEFLLDEYRGCKFVAWNANRFDAYIAALALVDDPEFLILPFLTRTHALRGMRVQRIGDSEKADAWLFLDGLAMTGLEGVSLDKFTANFAPAYRKLGNIIDFQKGEQFDAGNAEHRKYAYRDSEGLYHGIRRAERILLDTFDESLRVTMGGACIRIFQRNIPADVSIKPLTLGIERIFREYVMRGGYCWCVRKYHGPVWKYDINQAYAAAMREAMLPCGDYVHYGKGIDRNAQCFIARVRLQKSVQSNVPFYFRHNIGDRIRSSYSCDFSESWLTSIELRQLESEGWRFEYLESVCWSDSFQMQDYVDRLERLRSTCDGGPKGPIGIMVKAVGNHSYGKTVEELLPIEYCLACEPPANEGWVPLYDDVPMIPVDNVLQMMPYIWWRFADDQREKDYHAVHVGAFITAAVRMKVRKVAMLAPESFLYADTDCVMFDRDMSAAIDIDSSRYGAWKIEEEGAVYRLIAKKVYSEDDGLTLSLEERAKRPLARSSKALHVRELTDQDIARWYNDLPPSQVQKQRGNFLRVVQGDPMFQPVKRRGTAPAGGYLTILPTTKKSASQGSVRRARCWGCGRQSSAFRME